MERFGTIKLYRVGRNQNSSWGFISQDKGDDIFFRRSDIDRTPEPGQRVSFLTQRTPKGLRAVKVEVLDLSKATCDNWHEFIGALPFPAEKLGEDQIESRREKNSSALKGSRGLR